MTQAILTLQSHVAMGHVGLEAARLPLYLAGFDLWALPTVLFSNHPGHGHFKGAHTPQNMVLDMLEGVDQMQNWPLCAGILTGYMGQADTARLVFEKLRQIKAQNPHLSFCLDPVMGDNDTGLYVADDLPDIFLSALDFADILTPNHFELELLVGQKLTTLEALIDACQTLRKRGTKCVVVTSVDLLEFGADKIGLVAVSDSEHLLCLTDKIPLKGRPNGAGDCFAAMLYGDYLRHGNLKTSLNHAANAIFSLIAFTVKRQTLPPTITANSIGELDLIAARDVISAPEQRFAVKDLVFSAATHSFHWR